MKTHANTLSRCCGLLLTAACWSMLPLALAQEVESAADIASRVDQTYTLPADTELHLRMLDSVASNTHKRLDRFQLELVDPVMFEDRQVIPVGSIAEGEVVHAAKAGMAGKPGELILTTRLLRLGDREIKLRSFSARTGQNRYNLATGLGVTLGLPALFVTGKNISVPSGTDVYAKVAGDHVLPIPHALVTPETQPTSATDQNEHAPE